MHRAGALLLLVVSGGAHAASPVQQSFRVSTDVVAGCAVATSGGSWGSVDLGSVTGVAVGTVSAALASSAGAGLQIECTPGTTVAVTADSGSYGAAGVRYLGIAGVTTARIPYLLYANGAVTPWTTQAVTLVFPVGTARRTLPVTASAVLTGSQRAGAYADTVRITLSW